MNFWPEVLHYFFENLPLWTLGTIEIVIKNTKIEVFKVL